MNNWHVETCAKPDEKMTDVEKKLTHNRFITDKMRTESMFFVEAHRITSKFMYVLTDRTANGDAARYLAEMCGTSPCCESSYSRTLLNLV